MNPESDNQLESEIDRQLKDLPDLAAPSSLMGRTLRSIAKPTLPWYARTWPEWPVALRVAFFVLGLAIAVGAIPAWRAIEPGLTGAVMARLSYWTSGVQSLWNAVGALAGAFTAILNHWGKGVLPACVLAMAMAYAVCVGIGIFYCATCVFRVAK